MSLATWQATIQDEFGNAVPNAIVTVRNDADDTLASVFDMSGSPISNPIETGLDGFAQFQVRVGKYKIECTKGGSVSQEWFFDATNVSLTQPYSSRAAAEAAFVPSSVSTISWIQDGFLITARRQSGSTAIVTADGGTWEYDSGTFGSNVTVLVPDDYPSVRVALQRLSNMQTTFNTSIEIRIQSGHVNTSKIQLSGGDWSRFRITSEDAVVLCNMTGQPSGFNDVFDFQHCRTPKINALFNMQGIGSNGIRATNQVDVFVGQGCGVINAGNIGLRMEYNCRIMARFSVWSGAAQWGAWIEQACTGDMEGSTADNCGQDGFFVNHASSITLRICKSRNNGRHGVYSRHLSKVGIWNSDITGNTVDDLHVEQGGMIEGAAMTSLNPTAGFSDSKVNVRINEFDPVGMIVNFDDPKLNQYGSWTPTLGATTTDGSHTYSERVGNFVRSGRMVTVRASIRLTALDPAINGNIRISGLPFPIALGDWGAAIIELENVNIPSDAISITEARVRAISGTPYIELRYTRTGSSFAIAGIPHTFLNSNSRLVVTATYAAAFRQNTYLPAGAPPL
jgi:hypothetical protein